MENPDDLLLLVRVSPGHALHINFGENWRHRIGSDDHDDRRRRRIVRPLPGSGGMVAGHGPEPPARKLDRVSDDAAALLSEVDPENEGAMTLRERRTVAICRRLGEEFHEDELEATIEAVAGDSTSMLREYREGLLDRL